MAFLDTHKTDPAQKSWRLVEIAIGGTVPTTLRYTECDVDIEYDGKTWTAAPIMFGEIRSQPDGLYANFSVADADHVIFALLNTSNGAEAAPVSIWQAYFADDNATAAPDQVMQVFAGQVETAMKTTAGNVDEVEFQCGPQTAVSAVYVPWRLLTDLVRRK